MEFLDHWFQRNIALGLPSKNINTTAPYLALLPLSELTGNQIYRQMCTERAEWLMNTLPRTKYEVFQHVTSACVDRNGVNLHEMCIRDRENASRSPSASCLAFLP